MNKVKRKELVEKANEHELRLFQIEKALEQHGINWFSEEPKLKQLDQSIFDGLDAKWRFAAVDANGDAYAYVDRPVIDMGEGDFGGHYNILISTGYDTSNWQDSLIERDIAKELLEVDLSSELTGSDLCRAMLARGDKYVLCHLSQTSEKSAKDVLGIAIGHDHSGFRVQRHNSWQYAVPINNQGEPLIAADVGL